MDEKELQRMEKRLAAFERLAPLLDEVESGGISKEEIQTLFEAIVQSVDGLRDQVESVLASKSREMDIRAGNMESLINESSRKHEESAVILDKARGELENKFNEVRAEVERVRRSIPLRVDLSPLNNELASVKDEVTKLPSRKIKQSQVEGLEEELKELRKRGGNTQIIQGGIVGRDIIKDYDLSSQLDGVTTTFNISGVYNIISVALSSFPYGSLRKNVDYTYTPTSITFTSQIDPATQLAAGQSCVLTVVTA